MNDDVSENQNNIVQNDTSKNSGDKELSKEELKEMLFDAIKEIEDDSDFFIGSNTKVAYITWVDDDDEVVTDVIKGELFKAKLLKMCQNVWDKVYSPTYINNITYRFAAVALTSKVEKEIYSRIAKVGDEVIYNLHNKKQEFIVVTPAKK